MRRRTWAGLLALVLLVGMSVVALRGPVPYGAFAAGPPVNVLGKTAKGDIISVAGHTEHRDKGGLRLLTVIPSGPDEKVSIPQLVTAWLDPDRSVYPFEAIYPKTATQQSVKQQSTQQMTSSQDLAVAAALGALHIPFKTGVQVAQVEKDGPADGKLQVGDELVAVNGRKAGSLEQLTSIIKPLPVGTEVSITVKRQGKTVQEKMKTASSTTDKKASAVRIAIQPCCYQFPFDV